VLGLYNCTLHLEEKLQRKLHQPRILDLGHLAELRAIGAVSVRVIELCVIEEVEQFSAEFEVSPLVQLHPYR